MIDAAAPLHTKVPGARSGKAVRLLVSRMRKASPGIGKWSPVRPQGSFAFGARFADPVAHRDGHLFIAGGIKIVAAFYLKAEKRRPLREHRDLDPGSVVREGGQLRIEGACADRRIQPKSSPAVCLREAAHRGAA